MKKLYLVDVSSMFFRAFYAIRPLTNPSGLPVNALYGFLSMTVKLLREIRPDYMAFCFDRAEPTFRSQIYPEYKAHREEMPADLAPQIPYFRRLSEALGIACFDREGYEADDLIGTLTSMGREQGLEVVIVSGDKDFGQLVKPFVSMYDTMKEIRYDESGVVEKWGIEPRKMTDYLAIVGDSSDNVPGVTGVGAKGAQKLLAEFESLEDIYAHLDRISSASLRRKLEESRDQAFMSKKLVTIVCDLDLHASLDDLRLKPIQREELSVLLAELDFKSFARTLLGEAAMSVNATAAPQILPSPVEPPAQTLSPQTAAFVRPAEPQAVSAAVSAERDFGVIEETRLDLAQLRDWLRSGQTTWALQTERGSFLAQASSAHGSGWRIAEIAAHGDDLGRLLDEKQLKLCGFDLKDFAKRHGVTAPHIEWDQMLAAYVVRAGLIESPQKLFTLYNGESLAELPTPAQLLTAHLRLRAQLEKKLKSIEGEKVLYDIEQPLVPILLAMENAGVLIDTAALKAQSADLVRDIAILEKQIHSEVGVVFNIGSPKQLGQILFEKLKMPPGKRTKTGYSTDNEVLEKLANDFPITAQILNWRELTKLRSTYVDALPLLVNPKTGRVHTTFNQALTATGRLSSTNPNLQNIPIRTERGHKIRKAFIAAEGHQLVSADYSQIELRVLAHITNDPGLMRAFETDSDIHRATASEIFAVKIEDVTSEMRRKAKAVNFGLAYGQGAFGLAETLKIPRGEASEIITRYFERFPGVKSYMTATVEEAQQKGFVQTVFGRRRYIDELFSKSPAVRKFGERAAINAPIQGTASDLVKLAMISVGFPPRAQLLLQVHDELVLEAESQHVDEVCRLVATKMENVARLRVPLKVNTGRGKSWEEAHS